MRSVKLIRATPNISLQVDVPKGHAFCKEKRKMRALSARR
jgi:hypothetical protein